MQIKNIYLYLHKFVKMFIPRRLAIRLQDLREKFPILSLTGPRQSGKTTLLRNLFPDYQYVSLENPDQLAFAQQDPRKFLERYDRYVIFDEAQRVPELFNYLQGKVDADNVMGQYILSGSQNYLLLRNISQSLAGRVALFKLFPFSFSELESGGWLGERWEDVAFTGFYPQVFDRTLLPQDFYPNYFETYVQRDVRDLQAVQSLTAFRNFVRLCAGRVGQVINYQTIAADAGVSPVTAKAWLSILESSHLVFYLPPYFKNFNKRISKSPKLYFHDTGLVCYLLGLKNADDLLTHYARGNLFENLVLAELVKQAYQRGWSADLYFWRESNGHEVDLLSEHGTKLRIGEIKSSSTINTSFFSNLLYLTELTGESLEQAYLIYGGSERQTRSVGEVCGWRHLEGLLA